jgi:hypothetical protein
MRVKALQLLKPDVTDDEGISCMPVVSRIP